MEVMTETGADLSSLDRRIEAARQFCLRFTEPIAFIGVLGILIAAGVTVVDVLMRWLFHGGVLGLNEVTTMAFFIAVAACIPSGMARGVGVVVDVLTPKLAPRTVAVLRAIGAVMMVIFLGLLGWRMAVYGWDAFDDGRTTVLIRLPIMPFVLVAATLLLLATAVQVVMATVDCRVVFNLPADPAARRPGAMDALVIVLGVATAALVIYCAVEFKTVQAFAQSHVTPTVSIAIVIMWVLLLLQLPLAGVMGLLGLGGAALFLGFPPSYNAMVTETLGFLGNYQIAVLPLFLMMGSFATTAGVALDAYALAHAGLSRFRGGLAMATIGGAAGLGAVTGSSVATAAAIGRVAMPEMASRGYSPALSSGAIAAGGTLGNFVPPGSGPLVLFALMTEASIGQLFVASVVPAALVTIAYLVTVVVFVRVHPSSAPAPTRASRGETLAALRRCGPLGALFFGVLGGMYTGVFTATEAASVGAIGAFLSAIWRGKLRRSNFMQVMGETTEVTAMIYTLIFGALTFAFFCDIAGITVDWVTYIRDLDWSPLLLIAVLLVMFLLLGTFMDSNTLMILTIPIVTPLVIGAGYDIVWWGIINLFVVEIGAISPPFGLNMFILKSFSDVPIATIFYGATWFCLAAIFVLAFLVLFPQISLWLPSTMFH